MPAQRDEPSAPPQAENDVCQRIIVALRATGRLVPAFRRGMRLPYGVRAELLRCLDERLFASEKSIAFFAVVLYNASIE